MHISILSHTIFTAWKLFVEDMLNCFSLIASVCKDLGGQVDKKSVVQ